jgi:hypothetical protein
MDIDGLPPVLGVALASLAENYGARLAEFAPIRLDWIS